MEYATGQQIYDVIVSAASSPISVSELKLFAKISGTGEDALLQQIIDGVTLEAERYTKRVFVQRTFRTWRDSLGDFGESPAYVCAPPMRSPYAQSSAPVVLRRSPLISVSSVKYYSAGVLTTMNADLYQVVKKPAFSMIAPLSEWVTVDNRFQAVEIDFVAGYATVPADIKNALLAHATSVYQNRGDCDTGGSCSCSFAPSVALAVYQQYRIVDFVA